MRQIKVRHTPDNYGLALSGKLGSRPELELAYVQKLASMAPGDGVTSLREALAAYKESGSSKEAWERVLAVQEELESTKQALLDAGYETADLTKLAMDNT